MNITVADWTWKGDESDNLSISSSWTTRSLVGVKANYEVAHVTTLLAYSQSGVGALVPYTFYNASVIRTEQKKSGSLYRQAMSIEYPDIYHASMSADNVVIRLKDVTQVSFDEDAGYYIRFHKTDRIY